MDSKDQVTMQQTATSASTDSAASDPAHRKPDSAVAVTTTADPAEGPEDETPADDLDTRKTGWLAYFKTKEFYITLLLGQVLALLNTGTSSFTTALGREGKDGWAIPAFQTFLNYTLLNMIFTPYTIYRYGFKGWLRMVWRQGWKYFILAFCDVEGNFFIVYAYQYTTMMSAQLINFWAIVVVVVISFLFLKVRYHYTQVIGILVCIGGMGVLIGSDHLHNKGGPDISRGDQVKGDMFALLGASFYGLTNTAEEYFVSTRPVYEVLGQLSFFAMFIGGTQSGIFEHDKYLTSVWDANVGGYLVGYTLCLSLFYCLAPLLFRLASAAFFNISMLTMNFWIVAVGVGVFGFDIHWMYAIAFVLIIVGQLIYYLGRKVLGESRKPWLGKNQEKGVSGVFTAKKKIDASTVGHGRPGSSGGTNVV